jgi:hypothetical protein
VPLGATVYTLSTRKNAFRAKEAEKMKHVLYPIPFSRKSAVSEVIKLKGSVYEGSPLIANALD